RIGMPMLPDRFWEKVIQRGECWEWAAARTRDGYGRFRWPDRTQSAHRAAYEDLIGEIPPGLQLDHLCRNRACVNTYHLEPVTGCVNRRRGIDCQRDRCPVGHPYSDENLIIRKGRRSCRACGRAASLRYYHRHKGVS